MDLLRLLQRNADHTPASKFSSYKCIPFSGPEELGFSETIKICIEHKAWVEVYKLHSWFEKANFFPEEGRADWLVEGGQQECCVWHVSSIIHESALIHHTHAGSQNALCTYNAGGPAGWRMEHNDERC